MGNYSARFGGGHLEKGSHAPRQVSTLRLYPLMLGPIEHHGFRSISWMHLNATLWHNHQGICIEQGSQNMRTLVACCMGNETSITPLHIGTYIVATHNAVTDTVL